MTMQGTYQEIWEQVQALAQEEQLALAEAIIHRLRNAESSVTLSEAWETELNRRDAALARGDMPMAGWQEVKRRIKARYRGQS